MNAEFNKMRTDLANNFASAGAALLDYMTIDGTKTAALAAIPESDPQQYAIAGTLAGIAAMLPKAVPSVEAMVASEPVVTPWEDRESLYENFLFSQVERMEAEIAELRARLAATTQASTAQAEPGRAPCRNCIGFGWEPSVNGERRPCAFCATSSTDAQAAAEVRSQWISVDDRLPENGVDVIILHWPYDNRENTQVADTAHHVEGVFYDEDGNDMHPPSHWMPLNLPVLRSAGDTGGAQ